MKQRALRATARGASTTENLLEEERQLTRIDHDYDDIPVDHDFGIEKDVERSDLATAKNDDIQSCVVRGLAFRA
jgi:hypothetical protein